MEKKKMTKAEAFEYLKNAKIYVGCKRDAVLRKLFDIGLEWTGGGRNADLGWDSDAEVYGLISRDGKVTWVHSMNMKWLDNLAVPLELRANDVLSIEIVEGTPKFSYEKVVELAKPLMEYLNDTGWMEQIGVSYDHIVAQPMATFLHGEMKGC